LQFAFCAISTTMRRGFELFEILIQMSERVFLDELGVIAQVARVGEGRIATPIARHQRVGKADKRLLQPGIG
jgi:hypothetical protein